MKKVKQLVILISGLVFLMSCGRQINCPGFNKEVLEWIPYQNNDTIRLINSSNNSVMNLAINEVIIKHKSHYMTNEDCGECDDEIQVNEYGLSANDLHISIYLNENNIVAHDFLIKDVYFSDNSNEYNEQTDYTLGAVCYDKVWVFEKSDKSKEFIKLIVAKGFGIVGLVDKNGDVWVLKSTTPKNFEKESVEIRDTSCG